MMRDKADPPSTVGGIKGINAKAVGRVLGQLQTSAG